MESRPTLFDRLREHAERAPGSAAFLAPGRATLSYAGLWAQVQAAVDRLNALGVGRGDTVALVLPNGPEMAAALLSTMAAATAAPLNPDAAPAEFEYYLSTLRARALVVTAGSASPAIAVAQALGIRVLELSFDPAAPAGTFSLTGLHAEPAAVGGLAQPEDIALVAFTSGSTGRAKRVPMPLATASLAAHYYVLSLELTAADRCVNVMPLFHAHGIMAALLASMTVGASVYYTPGFLAPQFFAWLREAQATWYTAVPALHQAVLARAAETSEALADIRPLRMVRSASAALPASVREALERTFHAPVIQGYGITEANLVASTSPRWHKPGSVGRPLGHEAGVMAPGTGTLLPPGQVGEIVLRGPTVFPGYLDDPEANARAFAHGWYHTGDQGYVDADGFIFITGRIKELISRGAEKVAPVEVEEALLAHPAVAEAVAFGIPHPRLGEVVGAAVVARPGQRADETMLRRFVAERLSFYKVPEQVVILDALPRGPVGKVPRLGLAAHLGLTAAVSDGPAPYEAPQPGLEQQLAALWEAVLHQPRIGRHDRFLDLGGDSLLATQLVARVAAVTGLNLTLLDFFDAPTVAQQAALVAQYLPTLAGDPAEAREYGSL